MKRRLQLAIGCLACATSAVSAVPAHAATAVGEKLEQRGLSDGPVTMFRSAEADWTFPQTTTHPSHPSVKTYLVYPKTGRPLRVEAETIGFVRDGVVVLHNSEGQPIAVIPVAETAGVIEERSVISGEEPAPKAKGKASSKHEAS